MRPLAAQGSDGIWVVTLSAHRQRRGACGRFRDVVAEGGDRRPEATVRRRGEKTPLPHQEAVGGDAQGSVVMENAPAAPFKMTQTEFLFEFLIIALDDPSLFGQRTRRRRGMDSGRFDSQYFVGSFSSLGHSISSHCSGCGSLRQ